MTRMSFFCEEYSFVLYRPLHRWKTPCVLRHDVFDKFGEQRPSGDNISVHESGS